MPSVRRQARLVLAGAKLEVTTNALDMVRAERDGEGPVTMGMRTVHQACLRLDLPGVPSSFESFLEQLDDFEDLSDEGEGGELDPTRTPG